MEKFDVVAPGELLIDFTESGRSPQGNPLYEANPGGAPGNVLAMLRRLGRRTALIGKTGDDFFGEQLKKAFEEAEIHTDYVFKDDTVHTTLAFVHNDANGERDFSFYRSPGADLRLTEAEVPEQLLRNTKIFHFGSLSMTHEGVRAATKKAVRLAKEAKAAISFDPNLRESLWPSLKEAREEILYGISQCDILKISDNEICWLTGKKDFSEAVDWILERYPVELVLVSAGSGGSFAYYHGIVAEAPAFIQKATIETTGAGDTFCACILNGVLNYGLRGLTAGRLKEMLCFANAAASIITTRKGALKVMPTPEEIRELMERYN